MLGADDGDWPAKCTPMAAPGTRDYQMSFGGGIALQMIDRFNAFLSGRAPTFDATLVRCNRDLMPQGGAVLGDVAIKEILFPVYKTSGASEYWFQVRFSASSSTPIENPAGLSVPTPPLVRRGIAVGVWPLKANKILVKFDGKQSRLVSKWDGAAFRIRTGTKIPGILGTPTSTTGFTLPAAEFDKLFAPYGSSKKRLQVTFLQPNGYQVELELTCNANVVRSAVQGKNTWVELQISSASLQRFVLW